MFLIIAFFMGILIGTRYDRCKQPSIDEKYVY